MRNLFFWLKPISAYDARRGDEKSKQNKRTALLPKTKTFSRRLSVPVAFSRLANLATVRSRFDFSSAFPSRGRTQKLKRSIKEHEKDFNANCDKNFGERKTEAKSLFMLSIKASLCCTPTHPHSLRSHIYVSFSLLALKKLMLHAN